MLAPPVRALGDAEPTARLDAVADTPAASSRDGYALVVSRLAPEKGVDVAIDACRLAGTPLVIAGDGPQREALAARAQIGGAASASNAVRSVASSSQLAKSSVWTIVPPSRDARTLRDAAALTPF